MGHRPSGTVTFMFTDIEGSTRLWEEHPQLMQDSLVLHDALLRQSFERHDGYVFGVFGDGFGVAYSTPIEAITAAMEIQAEVAHTEWPHGDELRIRIAIDTGIADERDGDYFGPPLNRLGRVIHEIDGGRTLVTSRSASLVEGQLPDGVVLANGRATRLRDIQGPITVYEVTSDIPRPPPSRWRWAWISAVAITVAVVGTMVMLPDEPEESPESVPVTSDVAEMVVEPPQELRWTVPHVFDEVVTGGGIVAGHTDGVLMGLAPDDGGILWTTEIPGLYSLHSGDDWIGVVRRLGQLNRVDFIEPSTGLPFPGCGFTLPALQPIPVPDGFGGFSMTAEPAASVSMTRTETGAAVLTGMSTTSTISTDTSNLLLVVSIDLHSDVCHQDMTVQEGATAWPPFRSGPTVTNGVVLTGDSGTVRAFEMGSLEPVWEYFPGSGRPATYEGAALAMTGMDIAIQYASGIETESLVFVLDGEGLLHRVDEGDGVRFLPEIAGVVLNEHGVGVTTPDSFEVWSHDLAVRHAVIPGPPSAPPIALPNNWAVVVDQTLHFLGPKGQATASVQLTHPAGELIPTEGSIIAVGEAFITSVAIPGQPDPTTPEPRERTAPMAPLEVAFTLHRALDDGDHPALRSVVGADTVLLETAEAGSVLRWWFESETQAEFWTRVDLLAALDARTTINACETRPRADLDGVELSCSVTHADAFHDVFGVTFEGTSRIVVREGMVRLMYSAIDKGEDDTTDTAGSLRLGAFRGIDFGNETGEWFEGTWTFAQRTRADDFEAACGGLTPATATAHCGLFLLDVAPDYASTLR